jgi:putative membrane protein
MRLNQPVAPDQMRLRPGLRRFKTVVQEWFDPNEVDEVGHQPDYRFSLANERTFLAWIRTGLALIGGGLATAAFVPPLRYPYLREGTSIALLVLGAAIAVRAVDHWARSERAMRVGAPLPRSRFPAFLALTIAAGAILLAILILISGAHRP